MKDTILIVDDKVKLCETLAKTFGQLGYHALYATNSQDALRLLSASPVQVVLLDIMLGEENGIDILQQMKRVRANLQVIMITGYASIESAVQSIKLGAFDYVKKPLDFEYLLRVVENAIRPADKTPSVLPSTENDPLSRLITRHPQMLEVCEKARKLAATDLPVLIIGENGTGKELVADLIHGYSNRHAHAMLKINCAAFPETLLDNELFGHEKGAYTGANSLFRGVFERADQSSLFLDEIGDMPLTIQAKILRTLQNKEIRRLGGNTTITVNVRFIAATNKDVRRLISDERFREDLYYRLNTAVITIPPLRERKEDIPILVEHFLQEYAATHGTQMKQISETVLRRFSQYYWPGNVRELRNVVNYAAAISSNGMITHEDLPPELPDETEEPPAAPENIREEMEKNLILSLLQKNEYNKKRTAELLNMSRKTLYSRLRKYGIPIPKD